MRYLGFSAAVVLLCAGMALAQQQSSPQLPPGTTPPTFPQPDKDVGRDMPPDTPAKTPTSAEVEHQIQDKFGSEPQLADAKLQVKVNAREVVLSGRVADKQQHQAARRIAESYAGPRRIVDRIRVQP